MSRYPDLFTDRKVLGWTDTFRSCQHTDGIWLLKSEGVSTLMSADWPWARHPRDQRKEVKPAGEAERHQ